MQNLIVLAGKKSFLEFYYESFSVRVVITSDWPVDFFLCPKDLEPSVTSLQKGAKAGAVVRSSIINLDEKFKLPTAWAARTEGKWVMVFGNQTDKNINISWEVYKLKD